MAKYCLLLFLLPFVNFGQRDTTEQLKSVEVTGRTVRSIEPVAAAPVAAAPAASIKMPGNPLLLSTTENLNLAPGIAAFEGTAGTAKFSYRGFGARTQYTTSRSLIYLDEIPITSIQGFSSFEDLNPFWFSGLGLVQNHGKHYPSALGGVLKYRSRAGGVYTSSEVTSQLNFGSYGLLQSNSVFSLQEKNFSVLAGYENTSKDGWRENNSLDRQSLFLNSSWYLKRQKSLRLIAYGMQNRVEIPSSLSRQDFEENPEQAADSWARIGGFKEYDRLITGLTFSDRSIRNLSYSLTGFYRYLDNFEPRPFNILKEKRHSGGFRYSLGYDSLRLGKLYTTLSSFGEYQIGSENAATFQNVYDSLSNTYNNIGAGIENNRLIGHRINAGMNLGTQLGREKDSKDRTWWYLQTGVNLLYQYNQVSGADENFEVPFQLAPLLALAYVNLNQRIRPEVKLYRSFSVPALEENLDPDGSLNRGLKPELAWTGELGFDWELLKQQQLNLHLNYYYTQVENLIVPRVVGPDQVVATNSGSSQHTGLEFQLSNASYTRVKTWHPHFILSGYYGSFSYIEFSDTAGSFSGNTLPGFPDWQVNASFELKYDNLNSLEAGLSENRGHNFKFSFGFLGRYTSGYFVNDENTVSTEPYFLLQSWLRAERTFGKHFTASATFGVKNLTDTHYASMTVVNNQGFGGQPRFFYPGEPINWFGGLSLSYGF